MKNSYTLKKDLSSEQFAKILDFDMREIDNPNLNNPLRLNYIDRLRLCLKIVQREFPNPRNVLVGDFACAQANIGLSLAELGYSVYAIDINRSFIEYSKKKYEKGTIQWIVSELSDLKIEQGFFDIAIVGELVEHCAYPEEIIEKIFKLLRPGGYLLLTTPNGSMFLNRLPTFGNIQSKSERKKYEMLQFGPDAKNHLFLFKLQDIKLIVPKYGAIKKSGYCGGTILYNKITESAMKLMPTLFLEKFSRIIAEVPFLNKMFCSNVYAILRKNC